MNAHRKATYARDQLYHLKVLVFALDRDNKVLHPTPEYKQAMHLIQSVVEAAAEAYMAGDILEVVINRYTPMALPGFNPPTVLERLNKTPSRDEEDDYLNDKMRRFLEEQEKGLED